MKYFLALIIAITTFNAHATIQTEIIKYNADVPLTGFIAYDDAIDKAPGILIVHEWWGHNEHSRAKAIEFAKAGYVAFALDMYGKGKTADHPSKAKEFMMQALQNQEQSNLRFEMARKVLSQHSRVHSKKIGAVGYCFGGKVVLDQARQGSDLIGVVSIHGSLSPSKNASSKKIKTPILVLHGEKDPMIDDKALVGFGQEMAARKANYTFISYPDALHAFTNPAATKIGKEFNLPLAYNEQADQRAHQEAFAFFKNQK